MSKRGSRMEQLQKNYIKKGRGFGSGADYQPFIQAHDNKIASEGWITRHKGWKTGRTHHTLSEHERKYLYYCEWLDGVADIREQWPLLPIEKTIEIAKKLGIEHANLDGTPGIMTTDFRLTLSSPKCELEVIRTVKPTNKLDKRTLELFEIERVYFAEEGIDWCIVTEEKIPDILVKNVEWMAGAKYLQTRQGINEELLFLVSEPLFQLFSNDAGETSIANLCLRADKLFGLQTGTSMFILQHNLANKRWGTEIEKNLIKEGRPLIISDLTGTQHSSRFA